MSPTLNEGTYKQATLFHRGMEWGGKREEGSGWGTHVYLWQIHFNIWQNYLGGMVVKNLPANAGDARDAGSIPGLGRSPGGGNGNPLQYLA